MKLYNQQKEVNLNIPDILFDKLSTVAIQNYPNESGGFLVGYYSEDLTALNITDLILPNEHTSSKYSFKRSIKGINKIFESLFSSKKHYYIGEWHSHPDGSSIFSKTDLNAMEEIANSETVTITNPILLIVSINKTELKDFTFYIYDNKGLYKYE